MKRLWDIALASVAIVIVIVPLAIIAVLVRITSCGPVLFWSERVGRDNRTFLMPKFRTMYVDTPLVATDELENPAKHITKFGFFLRKSSLDELPQLYSVLVGNMSLVGPRPALPSQRSILNKRFQHGVHKLRPGITGWAQINGRDDLYEDEKVRFDIEYKNHQSVLFDFKIIWQTIRHHTSKGVWH